MNQLKGLQHKAEQARLERDSREEQARLDRQLREREIQDRLALDRELKEKEIVILKEIEEKKIEAEINKPFDVTRNVRMVPPFSEREVDKYFSHFEKVAESLKWPKGTCVMLLQTVLKGKAQEIFSALDPIQCSEYTTVKDAILKTYELVPEAYRQKFRRYKKFDNNTHVEFAREKENFFVRWCRSKEIGSDFSKLKQLVLVEDFKNCVRNDVKTYLDEHKTETLEEAAVLADEFSLTHKLSITKQGMSYKPVDYKSKINPDARQTYSMPPTPARINHSGEKSPTYRSRFQGKSDHSRKPWRNDNVICAFCHRPGHSMLQKEKPREL